MMNEKPEKLSLKRQKFCEEYIKDFNGARAARDAGYAESSATSQACELLKKEVVQNAISELLKGQQERTQIDADKIVEELAKIGFSNIKDYIDSSDSLKKITDLHVNHSAAIKKVKETEYKSADGTMNRTVREFELHDKLTALTKLAERFWRNGAEIAPEDIQVNVTIKRKPKDESKA